jgi:nucleoside-diphosphate-sugar epimerase
VTGPPRRVFITGVLGFIGGALAERYRELGAEVRGVDFAPGAGEGVVACDISTPGEWQRQAEGCDLVIHTAARVSFASDWAGFREANVHGTRNALDAAVRGGAERFVHFSSVVVFGIDFPDGVDERHPVRLTGVPYGDTKIAAEQVVLAAHAAGELPCTVVRPGDVWGPRSRPWTVIPVELIRSRRFVLPMHGRGIFSPAYIDNLVDGVVAAAGPPGAGQVLTISDGIGLEGRDFFGRYARMLGRRGVLTAPTPVAMAGAVVAGGVYRLLRVENEANVKALRYLCRRGTYSIEKARSTLGWEPRVGLDEGMERTERWLREAGLL